MVWRNAKSGELYRIATEEEEDRVELQLVYRHWENLCWFLEGDLISEWQQWLQQSAQLDQITQDVVDHWQLRMSQTDIKRATRKVRQEVSKTMRATLDGANNRPISDIIECTWGGITEEVLRYYEEEPEGREVWVTASGSVRNIMVPQWLVALAVGQSTAPQRGRDDDIGQKKVFEQILALPLTQARTAVYTLWAHRSKCVSVMKKANEEKELRNSVETMWGLQLNVVIGYLRDCNDQEMDERRISTETYDARDEATVYVEDLRNIFATFIQEASRDWVERVVEEYSETRGVNEHTGIPISAELVEELFEEMEDMAHGEDTEEAELLQVQLAHVRQENIGYSAQMLCESMQHELVVEQHSDIIGSVFKQSKIAANKKVKPRQLEKKRGGLSGSRRPSPVPQMANSGRKADRSTGRQAQKRNTASDEEESEEEETDNPTPRGSGSEQKRWEEESDNSEGTQRSGRRGKPGARKTDTKSGFGGTQKWQGVKNAVELEQIKRRAVPQMIPRAEDNCENAIVVWIRNTYEGVARSSNAGVALWVTATELIRIRTDLTSRGTKDNEEYMFMSSDIRTKVCTVAIAIAKATNLNPGTHNWKDGGAAADAINITELINQTIVGLGYTPEDWKDMLLGQLREIRWDGHPHAYSEAGLQEFHLEFSGRLEEQLSTGMTPMEVFNAYLGAIHFKLRKKLREPRFGNLKIETDRTEQLEELRESLHTVWLEVGKAVESSPSTPPGVASRTRQRKRSGSHPRGGADSEEDEEEERQKPKDTDIRYWGSEINMFTDYEPCKHCRGPHKEDRCWSLQAGDSGAVPYGLRILWWSKPVMEALCEYGACEALTKRLENTTVLWRTNPKENPSEEPSRHKCSGDEARRTIILLQQKGVTKGLCDNQECVCRTKPGKWTWRECVDGTKSCKVVQAVHRLMINQSTKNTYEEANKNPYGNTQIASMCTSVSMAANDICTACDTRWGNEDVSTEYGRQ